MSIPKKLSRREKNLAKLENFETIVYTKEEAIYLGYESEDDSDEEEDNEEDVDSDNTDEEESESSEETSKKPTYRKKPTDKDKYYVLPQEFDQEIMNYYDSDVMTDNLALMVSKIAHKLSYAPNFINYTDREEMVGDGIIRMFKALTSKKYDREKGTNPFSYFTRIAFNAFRNRIKKEKHLRDTHEKYQNELLLFSENYNTIVKNNQLKIQKRHSE
jgi:hypothetical protein